MAASAPDAQAQLEELVQFRAELERSAKELMNEYERVLGSLRVTTGATAPSPSLGAAPSPPPIAPGAADARPDVDRLSPQTPFPIPEPPPLAGTPAPSPTGTRAPSPTGAPAPRQPAPPAAPAGLDESVMDGAITVDAGPFTDIKDLSGFEQALGGVPGVRDVYVRGFEGSRALIDVTLGQPVALGTELRRFSPVAFSITAVDAGRLSVAIQGA